MPQINTFMTIRVHNGRTTNDLTWHNRNGVMSLEPPEGWVNPATIRAYFWTLTPKARLELIAFLVKAEADKSAEEDAHDLAYELAQQAQKPLTP